MQFVVPQFIDVEDKIIGPISVRQFVYLIIGTGLLFAAYRFADFSLFLIEAIIIVSLTMAFAFLKVNGRPFHFFLVNFLQTLRRPKLRVWRQEEPHYNLHVQKASPHAAAPVAKKPPLNASRLTELALVVDTGGVYKQEEYE
jgi:hypothetical protein